MGMGKPYNGKFIGSIVLAVLGVACQMCTISAWRILSRLCCLGNRIFPLCNILYNCTVRLSGKSYILQSIHCHFSHGDLLHVAGSPGEHYCKAGPHPNGDDFGYPSGQYKTTIGDRVEGMEPTFAHLIPEMNANVLVPLVIVVYLFILDWRMALLSLVTLVVGLVVMSAGIMIPLNGRAQSKREKRWQTPL